MISEAAARQRYALLAALCTNIDWNEADAERAIQATVAALPSKRSARHDADDLRAFFVDRVPIRHDAAFVNTFEHAAEFFGIDLEHKLVQAAIAGAHKALARSVAGRTRKAARAAALLPPGEAWTKPFVADRSDPLATGGPAVWGCYRDAKLQAVTGLSQLALCDALEQALGSIRKNKRTGRLAVPIATLALRGLNAGDVALAVLKLEQVRGSFDPKELKDAEARRIARLSGRHTTLAFEPRLVRHGGKLEIGYDVNLEHLDGLEAFEPQLTAFVRRKFAELSEWVAANKPLSER
jgi:hypothetical protein